MVEAQLVISKGVKQERVYGKPNPTFQNGHQWEKGSAHPSVEDDFTFMVIRHFYVIRDAIVLPKGS